MKTRVFYTRFWSDDVVHSVSKDARLLWNFLISNEYIGMTNFYKIPDSFVIYYTGLTPKELSSAKEELQNTRKIFFYNEWVYIPKLEDLNKYNNSPKNIKAYENELENVPKNVLDVLIDLSNKNISMDSGIDTTRHTDHKSKIINHKSKIRNQKSEIRNQKSEIESKNLENNALLILDWFKIATGCSRKSYKTWINNFEYWLEIYTMDDIKMAMAGLKSGRWWAKKPTPELLFRLRNPRGENVDYLGELIDIYKENLNEK